MVFSPPKYERTVTKVLCILQAKNTRQSRVFLEESILSGLDVPDFLGVLTNGTVRGELSGGMAHYFYYMQMKLLL